MWEVVPSSVSVHCLSVYGAEAKLKENTKQTLTVQIYTRDGDGQGGLTQRTKGALDTLLSSSASVHTVESNLNMNTNHNSHSAIACVEEGKNKGG